MILLFRLFVRHPWFFVYGLIKSFFIKKKPMTEPIDFVVDWVDDSDPEWLAEKRKYETTARNKDADKDNEAERYRNWELFRYWFRAVEQYAPWVNKVYLVTCGHVPSWINRDNPKLVIVSHKDYMDDAYLPTFNSNPIELNLHRIKGLSEHFVLFNDDTFLTQPIRPEDYFQDGKPLVCSLANPLINTPANETFNHVVFGNLGLANTWNWEEIIERHPEKWFFHGYGSRLMYSWQAYQQRFLTGLYFTHMPQAFRKSTFAKVWQSFPAALDEACRHRFRSPMDFNHQLMTLQAVADGDYVPTPRLYYGQYYGDGFIPMTDNPKAFADYIRHHRFKVICVNDSPAVTKDKYEDIRNHVQAALDEILPNQSSFENNNI